MASNEIEVPKDARPIMMEHAEETKLGDRNGCLKQYRYGNLHIREYRDKYMVHVDNVDPRKDPLGHLVQDSPEVIAGLFCAVYGADRVSSWICGKQVKKNDNDSKIVLQNNKRVGHSIMAGLVLSSIFGYAGYRIAKGVKINLGK